VAADVTAVADTVGGVTVAVGVAASEEAATSQPALPADGLLSRLFSADLRLLPI
jgi:hypothetical protein